MAKRREDFQVDHFPLTSVNDRDFSRFEPRRQTFLLDRSPASQVAGDLIERPLSRRQADPDEFASRQLDEPLQQQREEHSAFVGTERSESRRRSRA